jgi:hypothetical protein
VALKTEHPSSTEVNNWSYPYTPPRTFVVCSRVNFALPLPWLKIQMYTAFSNRVRSAECPVFTEKLRKIPSNFRIIFVAIMKLGLFKEIKCPSF